MIKYCWATARRPVSLCAWIAICSVVLYAAAPAYAAPIAFGSNHYEFIEVSDPFIGTNNSWFTARDSAAASSFNSVSGHLATITSDAENNFLFSLVSGSFTGFKGAWLGGKSPDGWLVGPEAGQQFTYSNWAGVEPNNDDYAYMSIGTEFGSGGQWADDSDVGGGGGLPHPVSDPVIGYFVEYEGTAVVPLPAAAWLFGSALLGLVTVKRKLL